MNLTKKQSENFTIYCKKFMKNFPATRIYSVDETGTSFVSSRVPKIIASKGKRQVGMLSAAERDSLITIICCMSAAETFIPPKLIFPRKHVFIYLKKVVLHLVL